VAITETDAFWTEVRRLRLALRAAGEDGWSVAVRDASEGSGRAGAAALVDTLAGLRSSAVSEQLGLIAQVDELIAALRRR
jgi:hypothetical protein